MNWFLLTILSINFYALVDVLDKILGDKQFKNTFAYAAITYILGCLVLPLLLFWTDFSSIRLDVYLFYAAISGPLYFLLWIFWWTGIKKVEVSRAGAVYGSMPIFSTFFAFLILHEVLSLSKFFLPEIDQGKYHAESFTAKSLGHHPHRRRGGFN